MARFYQLASGLPRIIEKLLDFVKFPSVPNGTKLRIKRSREKA
jgi:hypothetical protein